MDDILKLMQQMERSMERIRRKMFSDFDRLLPSSLDKEDLKAFFEKAPSDTGANVKTFKYFAKREIDSTGRDIQEVYMEADGEKKYWKKGGDKEMFIEPNKGVQRFLPRNKG